MPSRRLQSLRGGKGEGQAGGEICRVHPTEAIKRKGRKNSCKRGMPSGKNRGGTGGNRRKKERVALSLRYAQVAGVVGWGYPLGNGTVSALTIPKEGTLANWESKH